MRKGKFFLYIVLRKLSKHSRRKFDTYFTPLTEINSKWVKDLNIRTEHVKFQDENMGLNLINISLGGNFFSILHQKYRQQK